ncbi:Fic family protein [Corynebacterium felinum]|uniref:Fic family protein n=1 Tax=Corynebacterium felinum TaxID=131318 RepID=A0ABU2B7S3_9CORY|nr:Fic family protein [Corynebacterium felinum]MDF5820810.1 Fic family protein [Corynebacterium felinum]MDR7354074.1 Fic family protein [Corynebacterium felinum]WJY96246.1 Fic/DOC family protein [Corynebacterium felinum]
MAHKTYEKTHPWLSFSLDISQLSPVTWMKLGEIVSKYDHVCGAPLAPTAAQKLNLIYLSKGIHATTSIEGNTLSEEEVALRIKGQLELSQSLEYQGEEIDNLLEALNTIREECTSGCAQPLSIEKIKHFNKLILRGQPLRDDVVPGEFRHSNVLVGTVYRGAPPEDVDYLMERFIEFINTDLVTDHEDYKKPVLILRAILAHLYLAWIHPFGDGNGRTARLIETQLLFEAGLPAPSAHLLSDFYNRTRAKYYLALERASKLANLQEGLLGFIEYAVDGLLDGLRDQVKYIQGIQIDIAWVNFIHEVFAAEDHTPAQKRRKTLALAMPYIGPDKRGISKKELTRLTPELAELYAHSTSRTLSRDVNELLNLKLIVERAQGYSSNKMLMSAFLPDTMTTT